mmetsp:Transcript_32405/g.97561  ORF Transcript_32405/g.97561 Transcript_32405/m.97561 type:complete len:295 (+) Transcript_32405:1273-2157(+)
MCQPAGVVLRVHASIQPRRVQLRLRRAGPAPVAQRQHGAPVERAAGHVVQAPAVRRVEDHGALSQAAVRERDEVLHVPPVRGHLCDVAIAAELILYLHHDNRSPVGVEQWPHAVQQLAPPPLHEADVVRLVCPDGDVVPQDPRRQPAELPLPADVGPRPQEHQEPQALGLAQEGREVPGAREVEGALALLVPVPRHVGRHAVEPHGPQALQAVAPVGARHAGVVDGARADLQHLAVQHEGVLGHHEGPVTGGHAAGASEEQGGQDCSSPGRARHARRWRSAARARRAGAWAKVA